MPSLKFIERQRYTWLVLLTLTLGLFTFSLPRQAQAACPINIDQFDTRNSGKTTFTVGDTVKFYGEISRRLEAANTSQVSDCTNSYFSIYIKPEGLTPNMGGAYSIIINGRPDLFVNDKYTFTYSINLNDFPKTQLENKTSLVFNLDVSTTKLATAKTSWQVPFTYSGTVTTKPASGQIPLTLTVNTGGKQYLKPGDSFTVNIAANGANVRGLDNGIQKIKIETLLNGSKYGSYEVTRSWLNANSSSPTQEFKNLQPPQFQEGSNSIQVNMSDVTTGVPIGSGQAMVQVQGIQSAASGNQVQVIADKPSANIGDTIRLIVKNAPENWSAKIYINGSTTPIPMSSSPFSLQLTTTKGFKDNDQNNISVKVYDSNANLLMVADGGNLTINTGTAGVNNPANPAVTIDNKTGQEAYDCTQPNPDPRYCLQNPLPVDGLTDMVLLIMRGFTMVVAIWAVLFIIIGGFKMVIAAGNEEAIGVARKTITWAVLGLIIAMMAFSIVAIVQNFIGARAPGIQVNNPQGTPNK